MRTSKILPMFVTLLLFFHSGTTNRLLASSIFNEPNSEFSGVSYNSLPPVAVNDTFVLYSGCERNIVSGNILLNDYDPNGDEFEIYYLISPKQGHLKYNKFGDFELALLPNFKGQIKFEYCITEFSQKSYKAIAEVYILVLPDCDCDNVTDAKDIDNDNDGITDEDEGNGTIDTDMDGIPDSRDIDSDNDGIPDNVEWQFEDSYRHPAGKDINKNGLDDAYDKLVGGKNYTAVDTDNDSYPDYIDNDSDGDLINDIIEGNQVDSYSKNEIVLSYSDLDKDGLDDVFDNVNSWLLSINSCGSFAPVPDFNANGIRDWREFSSGPDKFNVHPNPVDSHCHIQSQESIDYSNTSFSVHSITGKLMFTKSITGNNFFVDTSALNEGLYFITIKSGEVSETKKILVSH